MTLPCKIYTLLQCIYLCVRYAILPLSTLLWFNFIAVLKPKCSSWQRWHSDHCKSLQHRCNGVWVVQLYDFMIWRLQVHIPTCQGKCVPKCTFQNLLKTMPTCRRWDWFIFSHWVSWISNTPFDDISSPLCNFHRDKRFQVGIPCGICICV